MDPPLAKLVTLVWSSARWPRSIGVPSKVVPSKAGSRSIGEPLLLLLPLVCQYTAVKQVKGAQVLVC